MANQPDPDDETVACEKRRSRWAALAIIAGLLFGIVMALLLGLALRLGIFGRLAAMLNVSEALVRWFPMVLLVAVWAGFMFYLRRLRPRNEVLRPSVQRKLVDVRLSSQRRMLLLFVMVMTMLSLLQRDHLSVTGWAAWFAPVMFVFIATLSTLFVVLGPGFLSKQYQAARNDELTRALRSRATKVGYVYAMAMMGTIYLLSLTAPQLLQKAIPISMASLFVIPALYLVWTEWQTRAED